MRRIQLLFVLFLYPVCSLAQAPATGFPPYGSFAEGGFDVINRQNLNVNFAIPIGSLPGRGMPFNFSIVYDSLIWQSNGVNWYPVTGSSGYGSWGWKTNLPIGAVSYSHSTNTYHLRCGTRPDFYYIDQTVETRTGYTYVDPAGTWHGFPVSRTDADPDCNNPASITGTFTGYATDGSGLYITIASNPDAPVVYTRSGTWITTTSMGDSNGNFISQVVVNSSETDWKDTANHTALRIVTVGANTEYHYLDTTGTDQKFTLKYQNYPIQTAFGCSGVADYNTSGTLAPASLPYELDLPNGQKYSFSYELTPGSTTFYTGRLTQVTLPTGGSIQYSYPAPNNGMTCLDGSLLMNAGSLVNLTRTVSDGVNTSLWKYVRSGLTQPPSGFDTTVTQPQLPYDADSNTSAYHFNTSGQEESEQFRKGSAWPPTALRTITIAWAANGTPAARTVILEDSTENQVETSFDTNGNILSVKEHDWGATAPGPIIRATNFQYLNTPAYVSTNILDRVTQITVADAAGTTKSRTDISYDEPAYINFGTCHAGVPQHNDSYSCTSSTRGNPTTVTTYTNAAAATGSIVRHSYYDNLGNLVQADVNCCQTKQWNFSTTTNYAYPDSVVRGPAPTQLTTSATYNAYTGLIASATDENNQQTSYTYDVMKRLVDVQRPDLAHLTWSYSDALPPALSTVTSTVPVQDTRVQKTTVTVDGIGRPIKQQVTDAGAASYSISEVQYDPLGRSYKTSNPHNSTAQYWTETRFDGLGRPTMVIPPDGTSTSNRTVYSYATNTTTLTDPAGKARKSQLDGLGRLINVWEPDVANPNPLTQQTSYAYDSLDRLTGVTQGVQSRSYTYDDAGRLITSTTPEAGVVCFGAYSASTCQSGYDSFGNLLSRTDARGVVTNYSYDGLNRLIGTSYTIPNGSGVAAMPNVCTLPGGTSPNANVCLSYGTSAASYNNGRLVSMTDASGSESYAYDKLGQITQLQKTISGATYPTGYAYNLAGALTQITYPSGRVVQRSFDAIGRLCEIAPQTTGCGTASSPYASGFAYNPAQLVTGFNYGNGVTAAFGYTPDRLLLQSIAYVKGTTTLFSANYWYKTDATNCPSGTAGNNGQIQCITDNVDAGRSANYTYDALGRVSTAQTKGSANYPLWGLSWNYDRYGNRLAQTVTAGSGPPNSVVVDATTNHITGAYAYDASGNMTNDGINTLVYDAENRAVSASNGSSSGTYTYDGNGLRVKKVSVISATTTTTVYVFSGSKVIAEYDNGAAVGSPSREYIYARGAVVAKIEGGATIYYHQDHLSNRVISDSMGNGQGMQGHYPFGESWYAVNTTSKWVFTSYERDAESGNDYALARSYANRLARFSQGDPVAGSISDPQSLNRYTYARNMPTVLVDPSGMKSGCYYVENWDAGSSTSRSGGPSGISEEDLDNSTPEPAQFWCPPGGSGGAGYPIGGGNVFDLLMAWWGTNAAGTELNQYETDFPRLGLDLAALSLFSGFGPGGDGTLPPELFKVYSQPPLSQKAADCLKMIQDALNKALGVPTTYLEPTNMKGASGDIDPNRPGWRNGAFNFNFRAPGFAPGPMGPSAIPNARCGRFPDGLHLIVNGGGCNPDKDPNVYIVDPTGFTFTTHRDSADPSNPGGALVHFLVDYLMKVDHGC